MNMKKSTIILISLTFLIWASFYAKQKLYDSKQSLELARTEIQDLKENNKLKDGDIIFQTSLSLQSKAIQLATDSKYSIESDSFEEFQGKNMFPRSS